MDHHPTQSASAQDGRSTDGAGGVAEKAADAVSSVKDSGAQVADTAKDRLGDVVSESKTQAANLAGDVHQRLTEEARKQTGRAGEVLGAWADDLGQMARRSEQDSPARVAVQQLSEHGKQLAEKLRGGEPEQLLDDVRAFARRKPAAFLLGSALAGFAIGRLAKGLSAANQNTASPAQVTPDQGRHAATPAPAPEYPPAVQDAYTEPIPTTPPPVLAPGVTPPVPPAPVSPPPVSPPGGPVSPSGGPMSPSRGEWGRP
ncbi:hypothetical protein ACOBQX_08905 [Actinokineospora sp. G85]|uniref:hypothetical protein n=1 Tax=Actinokineospora sp. G85 TaxID=3406626 RepID=UPI003C762B2F